MAWTRSVWGHGEITEYRIQPEDFGINSQSLIGLEVDGAAASYALIHDALHKRELPYAHKAAEMISLNAGAALYVSGIAGSLKEGIERAHDTIYTGLALEKLTELVSFTSVFKQESEA